MRIGPQHHPHTRPLGGGSRHERDASVPHPRVDGLCSRSPQHGRFRLLHPGLRCAQVLQLAHRSGSYLVLGGAHHAPGGYRPGAAQRRGCCEVGALALHQVVLGLPSCSGHGSTRGPLRCSRRRGLRDDRGRASDDMQTLSHPQPASRARLGRRPARKWRSWEKTGSSCPAAPRGKSLSAAPTSPPGTTGTRRRTRQAFTDGWFRTGDLGVMDEDGYLTVSGRIKEIINRGGEKVSPREVDDVLMEHPAVQQVVTFAMPHGMLGEDVAAVVVLHEDQEVAPGQLRSFASDRIASYKVPRKILVVDEIPKGPTGKLRAHRPRPRVGAGLMRVCIYGAGAIGGYLGAQLALAGADVTLIAPRATPRGHESGRSQASDQRQRARGQPPVYRRPGRGRHPRLRDRHRQGAGDALHRGARIQHLLDEDTPVVTAVNGIPWWYFYEHGGEWDGHRLQTVDPGNLQWDAIGPHRVIGCVVYPAAEVNRTRGHTAHRGEPFHPRRTGGRENRPHHATRRDADPQPGSRRRCAPSEMRSG